jgi:predicted phosphoadenosine phosphosulfate sulfurtransferase
MKKVNQYIKNWEARGYSDGIPDEVPFILMQNNLAPSYKAICFSIMKNDFQFKLLGYERQPCKVYSALKKIEIEQRNEILQAELF